jgi:hypothetical protein
MKKMQYLINLYCRPFSKLRCIWHVRYLTRYRTVPQRELLSQGNCKDICNIRVKDVKGLFPAAEHCSHWRRQTRRRSSGQQPQSQIHGPGNPEILRSEQKVNISSGRDQRDTQHKWREAVIYPKFRKCIQGQEGKINHKQLRASNPVPRYGILQSLLNDKYAGTIITYCVICGYGTIKTCK